MYSSTEIKLGQRINVVPSWMPDQAKRPMPAKIVYIHPEERYFTVEYTYDVIGSNGRPGRAKFGECFLMVKQERLCSQIGRSNETPILIDYDESEE